MFFFCPVFQDFRHSFFTSLSSKIPPKLISGIVNYICVFKSAGELGLGRVCTEAIKCFPSTAHAGLEALDFQGNKNSRKII